MQLEAPRMLILKDLHCSDLCCFSLTSEAAEIFHRSDLFRKASCSEASISSSWWPCSCFSILRDMVPLPLYLNYVWFQICLCIPSAITLILTENTSPLSIRLLAIALLRNTFLKEIREKLYCASSIGQTQSNYSKHPGFWRSSRTEFSKRLVVWISVMLQSKYQILGIPKLQENILNLMH